MGYRFNAYIERTVSELLPTLKILFTIALYELSKYVTNQILIRKQANDDIDQPKDYEDVK